MTNPGRSTSRVNAGLLSLAAVFSLSLGTTIYAGQAKPPAKPMAKPAAAAAKPAAPAASPESIASGAAIFKRQCQMCHGATGLGDGPASKMLKGKLPNFTDKAAMAKISDEDMHNAIENGLKTPVGNMPTFKAKLKPEEITDVMNFVRSLAK